MTSEEMADMLENQVKAMGKQKKKRNPFTLSKRRKILLESQKYDKIVLATKQPKSVNQNFINVLSSVAAQPVQFYDESRNEKLTSGDVVVTTPDL